MSARPAGKADRADRPGRYVALGDSFTEGVGDAHAYLPNGVRGWADRVAEGLAAAEPGWQYANLAVRSKRLRHVIAEQLEPALAMKPTLITLYAGGNDVMDLGTTVPEILGQYQYLVQRLSQTGATLMLFTGYDVPVTPLLAPLRRKNHAYNRGVRIMAGKYGAVLVDYATFGEYANPRMWSPDRLHMSKAGHRHLAAKVLELLEVEQHIAVNHTQQNPPPMGVRRWALERYTWLNDWVLPLLGRKLRGTTLGDNLSPRWPEPVRVPPRKGLRKLARISAAAAAAAAAGK